MKLKFLLFTLFAVSLLTTNLRAETRICQELFNNYHFLDERPIINGLLAQIYDNKRIYFLFRTYSEIRDPIDRLEKKSLIKDPLHKKLMRDALLLGPLLKSDIAYKALADEWASRGYSSPESVGIVMTIFRTLSLTEQYSFVKDVVKRMAIVLDSETSAYQAMVLDSSLRRYIRDAYDPDLIYFRFQHSELVKRWQFQKENGFRDLIEVLRLMLEEIDKDDILRVQHFRSWTQRLRNWFKKNNEFNIGPVSIKTLTTRSTPPQLKQFSLFLTKLSSINQIRFIKNHYTKFNISQLTLILNQKQLDLPNDLLSLVEKRLSMINTLLEIEEQVSIIKNTRQKPEPQLKPQEFKKIMEILEDTNQAIDKEKLEIFDLVFKTYGSRFTTPQFLQVTDLILKQIITPTRPNGSVYKDCILLLYNYSKFVVLDDNDFLHINGLIREIKNKINSYLPPISNILPTISNIQMQPWGKTGEDKQLDEYDESTEELRSLNATKEQLIKDLLGNN